MKPNISFSKKDPTNFFQTIRSRVNAYFEENNIKKTGGFELHLKTIIMLSLYLVPFSLILTQILPVWGMILCYLVMGVGLSGIGLCIMHDANHGSYSKIKWINNLMAYSTDFIGASSFTWKIQHNILHHSYTNIHHMDEDITGKAFLRLSPADKLKKYHRFQHIYAMLLYCFASISWVIKKDFKQLADYNKDGTTRKYGFNPKRETVFMIAAKLFYVLYILVLPIVLGVPVWVTLLGFLLMHMIAGLMITTIFQLAHVVEGPEHFAPPEDGKIDSTWFIHQLKTTANFAPKNRLITWFVGGLNFQIEHHLFPKISHIHYRKIANIVKKTAKEFDLPYHEYSKFRIALRSHLRFLKMLGQGAYA
jgi:linoleoyl-CoA desaturase